MSGVINLGLGAADLNQLVIELQNGNQILSAILQQLKTGVLLSPAISSYTVAGLPTTASAGSLAFASNGRKPSEGPGAGTGIPVFFNPGTGTWFSVSSGAVVTS